MNNPYPYSCDNKRYQTYGYYLKKRFGGRVYRLSLDVGAGCPNRDGSSGRGGCIFCSGPQGEGRFCGISDDRLQRQLTAARAAVAKKCAAGPYIVYFQSGSNTYGDAEAWRRLYESALGGENVAGLCIGTRADCIDEGIADMLGELAAKTYLTVELGLQTVHDDTAKLCNRCHTYEDFLRAYRLLTARGVNVGVHIINGLPGETSEMMLETARRLSQLSLHLIKIHMLYVERGTPLCGMYERGELRLMSVEEYALTVARQLELLPPQLIIARVTGDGDRERLIAPEWSLKKLCVLNEIDKVMSRLDIVQGGKYAARS